MKNKKINGLLIFLAFLACELALSWLVPGFSDLYVKYIFSNIENTVGRMSGLFSFSVGELLIYTGVLYALVTIFIWLIRFVKVLEKKKTFKLLCSVNTKIFFSIVLVIVTLLIQNCFILYHTTPFFEVTKAASYEANKEDLIDLWNKLSQRANALCVTFERNEKGEILYDKDFKALAVETMRELGDDARRRIEDGKEQILDDRLSLLSGYYSNPKPFWRSEFFCQQSMCGYYFPFTLEANYNDYMYVTNFPDTMCHELTHLKGFILEDEASFLSFLGCMNSKDPMFNYSGLLSALSYMSSELSKEAKKDPLVYEQIIKLDPRVSFDSMFITDETRERVEKEAVLDTQTVQKASDAFVETNLTLNGVADGIVSYSRMVKLLLKYYYG